MKSMIVSAVILGMTASTSFAGGVSGAVELTDAQMDAVNAGALVNVVAVDVVDAVVAATVQANVLGQAIQSGSSNAQNRNPVAVSGTRQQ